jgi:hypothetical protein
VFRNNNAEVLSIIHSSDAVTAAISAAVRAAIRTAASEAKKSEARGQPPVTQKDLLLVYMHYLQDLGEADHNSSAKIWSN